MPDSVAGERLRCPDPEPIPVLSPRGIVPRMKIHRDTLGMNNRQIVSEVRVERRPQCARLHAWTNVRTTGDLSDGMDAAIGPPREHRRHRRSCKKSKRVLELFLHGPPPGLSLRPEERGTVVGDGQLPGIAHTAPENRNGASLPG